MLNPREEITMERLSELTLEVRKRVEGAEDGFLVVLQILRIGQRQAFDDHREPLERAEQQARAAAHQFGGVGIALVRHDRRSGRPSVGQFHEAERLRRPQDDFLGETRQMDRSQRGSVEIVDHEVAVADRVETVGGWAVEAERLGGVVAVETRGFNQRGEEVCYFRRKVMVPKREAAKPRERPYTSAE